VFARYYLNSLCFAPPKAISAGPHNAQRSSQRVCSVPTRLDSGCCRLPRSPFSAAPEVSGIGLYPSPPHLLETILELPGVYHEVGHNAFARDETYRLELEQVVKHPPLFPSPPSFWPRRRGTKRFSLRQGASSAIPMRTYTDRYRSHVTRSALRLAQGRKPSRISAEGSVTLRIIWHKIFAVSVGSTIFGFTAQTS